MSQKKSFFALLIPSATVFISSACIMIIELVAGRLIARHLGSSLYTWTGVIGVILTGITLGNYLGGRIADRFQAKKSLSIIFCVSSIAAMLTVPLNNTVGEWMFLWHLSLPIRVFSHVSLVFLLPSTLLGMISPVVAKMALDQGLPTGRTVGDIYAWGVAGSIIGTFAAGFYLITLMGTSLIIWSISGSLLILALLFSLRSWFNFIWAAIFVFLVLLGNSSTSWAQNAGTVLGLRDPNNSNILYEDESKYCYVAVKRISENPDTRSFIQDRFVHSKLIMGQLDNFQHFYMHMYAAVTQELSDPNEKLTTLTIGGGGYVYPRYLIKHWPGSQVDVAEIDPGVTKAAKEAFGLPEDTKINTYNMDARNYIERLIFEQKTPQNVPKYDFIYEDAINHYTVPYQLVTKEFNEKIKKVLAEDGVYMVNLMDIYAHGKLLGSFVNTLEKSFPYAYIMTRRAPKIRRNVFIIAASRKKLNMKKILEEYQRGEDIWLLDQKEIAKVKKRAGHLVLTDDYAPVEHMLTPMIRQSAMEFLRAKYLNEAKKLGRQGKYSLAINKYQKLIETDHTMSVLAYNEIASLRAKQGQLHKAIKALEKAIKYNQQAEYKNSPSRLYLNLAFLTRETGEQEQADAYFEKAISAFKENLRNEPNSLFTNLIVAKTYEEMENLEKASQYYKKVVDLSPRNVSYHRMLAQSFVKQGKYEQALKVLKKAKGFMKYIGDKEKTSKIQEYIDFVEYKMQKNKDNSGNPL